MAYKPFVVINGRDWYCAWEKKSGPDKKRCVSQCEFCARYSVRPKPGVTSPLK